MTEDWDEARRELIKRNRAQRERERDPDRPPAWNWDDLVPKTVAIAQRHWERRQRMRRMRAAGLTYSEIARRMGLGKSYVGGTFRWWLDDPDPSPVSLWCQGGGEIAKLAAKTRLTIRFVTRAKPACAASARMDRRTELALSLL